MNNIDINLKDEDDNTALHFAASQNHIEAIEYLVENGAIVNAINNTGETPLFDAVYKGFLKVIEYLIMKGSDINIRNIYGKTPLNVAVEWSMTSAGILLKYGANEKIKDNAGNKPVDIANEMNYGYDYIELLKNEKS